MLSRTGLVARLYRRSGPLRPLLAVLREDARTHGRDWSSPGLRAIAVQRVGGWGEQLRSPLARRAVAFFYRWAHRKVRNIYGIEVHAATTLGRGVRFLHQGGVVIHEGAAIGDRCIIRHNVTIGAATLRAGQDAPVLGKRVEVGTGAVIMGAVSVGDDVRIGPNAVVTRDVPAGATVIADAPRVIRLPQGRASDR